MSSLNKVMLIGRLGKDPELKYTSNGTAVCSFSMATSEKWKTDDGKQEKTEWHNVVAWSKLAEVMAQYLNKGSQVYIEGKIQTRNYDDKSGVKRYVTEIIATNLIMLDSKKPETMIKPEPTPLVNKPDEPMPDAEESDETLPF